MPKMMCCLLLCMQDAVEGWLCMLEGPEVMHCVLLWLLEVWKVLEYRR